VTLKLKPQTLAKELTLPTSKSYANRLLIVAARLGGARKVLNLPASDDVTFLLNSFQSMGLKLEVKNSVTTFLNSFPECEGGDPDPVVLHVGEGGTTARFLLSLLSLGKKRYLLHMEGRLSQRPWEGLIQALRSAGAKIEWEDAHQLSIQGPVQPQKLPRQISCKDTTQFITSLQLSFFPEGLTFTPLDMESSEAYWQMTLNCAKDFQERSVPQDWSSASYPLVLAAIQGDHVLFRDLHPDRLQADCLIFDLLKERGAIEERQEGVVVTRLKSLQPLQVDGSKCLDLIPTLVVLALKLEGTSVITHVKGLIAKESNRLEEIHRLVKKLGANISIEEEHILKVHGPYHTQALELDPVADHRMVMMAALLLLTNEGGSVTNEQAVSKSFPNFFDIVAPTRK
jgi:3-phosphoshikimate 1-carboxyvinyltransferase